MGLEDLVYSLPSTNAFLDNIASRIREQVIIVLLPDHLSREMAGRLVRNRFEKEPNLTVRELSNPGDMDPLDACYLAMEACWQTFTTRRNIENLLMCEGLPDLLYVHRIGPPDVGWLGFIQEWAAARIAQRGSGQGRPPSLCIIAKLRDFQSGLPQPVAGLTYCWWWGFPSALEMRLACRIAAQQNGDSPTVRKWREYVLPSLASSDVQLAERIWNDVVEDKCRIIRGLIDYWESFDGTISVPELGNFMDLVRGETGSTYSIGQEIPEQLLSIWASGGLVYTPEYGLEVHPSLLSYTGHRVEVLKMVWRGQAELLLPSVNEIRLKICDALTTKYGSDWPEKWGLPAGLLEMEQVKASPLAAELGYLRYLFSAAGERGLPIGAERELSRLVELARDMRNQVAHYVPVVYQDFVELEKAYDQVGF